MSSSNPFLVLALINYYRKKVIYIEVAEPMYSLVYSMHNRHYDVRQEDEEEYRKFIHLIEDENGFFPNIDSKLGKVIQEPDHCSDFVVFWV